MGSSAYEKGFNACQLSGYRNPYSENSNELDDYERGCFQRLKRSGYSGFTSRNSWGPDIEPVREVTPKVRKPKEPSKANLYAQAKGK